MPTSAVGYSLNLRFPGLYFGFESELNCNVNRDYELAAGRYVQSDSLGLAGWSIDASLCQRDPLNYTHALGLCLGDGESGRYAACNASQKPEGSSTCCEADYNGCTGGKVLGEPPGAAKEAETMGKCIVKFQKCMSSAGKGG